jgi:hypothetical protein
MTFLRFRRFFRISELPDDRNDSDHLVAARTIVNRVFGISDADWQEVLRCRPT